MLPQLGFAEIIVLALLAIIVVGPKDLPKLMRSFGNFMSKIRGLGQEFKDAFDEMGAESEIVEMRRELQELKNIGSMDKLTGSLDDEMREIDRDLKEAANPKSRNVENTTTSKEQLSDNNKGEDNG